MNKLLKKGAIVVLALFASAALAACQGSSASVSASTANRTSGQVLPVATNPILNSATAPGLTITSAMVENNVDPATNNPISDCLQIGLKNISNRTMNNFEIFYKMTDSSSGASESYYQKLGGLSLAPGQSRTIFFDNGPAHGHYPENKYSIYRTSKNEVVFAIELSSQGFKPATSGAKKSPGTGEQKD